MSVLGEISIDIVANIAEFKKAINSVQTNLDSLGKNLTSIGTNLSTSVTLPILAIGTAATKLAMDAQESENLFSVSMGSMAQSARTWSDETAKSLGLNAYAVRENVGVLNAMTTSMGLTAPEALKMSEGLTQLSYDMASFYNLNPEEAFNKLKSGISGESEPLKALGILVNDTTIKHFALTNGIIKQGETMTEAQKVQARYGAIMEATKLAQGDLARTMDSPTNQLRIMTEQVTQLGIKFGELLIPTLQYLITTINPLIATFMGLSKEEQQLIITIGLVVAAIGPLLLILGTLSTGLGVVAGAISFLLSPIGIIILAIGALVAAFVYLWNTNDTFKTKMLATWNEIKPKLLLIWNQIKTAFVTTWNAIKIFWDKYGATITVALQKVWETISGIVSAALKIISGAVEIWTGLFSGNWNTVWEGVKKVFGGVWNAILLAANLAFTAISAAIGTLVLAIWNNGLLPVYNWLKDTFVGIFETVAGALKLAWNGLGTIVSGIWNTISDNFKSGINSVIGFINTFIQKVNKIKISVPEVNLPGIGKVGGGTLGFNVPEIPKLAKGGIVNSSTIAEIGEAGPEAIVPLENTSFVTKISEAIGNAVANSMGNSKSSGEIILNIDGNRIARVLNPYLQNQRLRVSDV